MGRPYRGDHRLATHPLRGQRRRLQHRGDREGTLVPESAVRTTKPKPPSKSWKWSKAWRAVRLHPNGGGGGHRTHVRKPSATGIYINSRLSRASRLSAPQPAGSPISQLLMFSPLTPERGLEPVTG